jgi:hypothetical protein
MLTRITFSLLYIQAYVATCHNQSSVFFMALFDAQHHNSGITAPFCGYVAYAVDSHDTRNTGAPNARHLIYHTPSCSTIGTITTSFVLSP